MLKALSVVDFSANQSVFSEPFPVPEPYRGLHPFINRKVNFPKTKLHERVEFEFEDASLFGVKLTDKHMSVCLVTDVNLKRRLVFKLLEAAFDLVSAAEGFGQPRSDLNSLLELRAAVLKEIKNFERSKGDSIAKIDTLQRQIMDKTQMQIDKEMRKMDDMMEVKTEVEEINKIAAENEEEARKIKREAFLRNLRMWVMVYGSTFLIVAGAIFIFFRNFL